MITKKKLEANRANAQKSSGPTTPKGKGNSAQNARKHGFFAKEPHLSDADRIEFEALTRDLERELSPTTTLQNLALQDIAHCVWRLNIASRVEARCTEALLQKKAVTETEIEGPAEVAGWYGANPQTLRGAIQRFQSICADFQTHGSVREEWKSYFDAAIGPGFYESLTQWKSMSYDAILLSYHWGVHAETFKRPLPKIPDAAPVVIDPMQGLQMVSKLLGFQLRHMQDLLSTWQQRSDRNSASSPLMTDFSPRYYTTAVRDWHRAVDWYWQLKEREKAA